MKFKVGDKIVLTNKEGAQYSGGRTTWSIGDRFIITEIRSHIHIMIKPLQKRNSKCASGGGYHPECFRLEQIDDWRSEFE